MSLTPTAEVYHGDCIETMNALPPESVDAIVTDPPYGLGFMGKKWDDLPPSLEWAEACYRVLKPGGHIAAFGGTRTWHRLAVAIEDAGFEMRDSLAWLYGSGFPKSMNVGKAITATETLGSSSRRANRMAMTGDDSRSSSFGSGAQTATTTATTAAGPPVANLTPNGEKWSGHGTALKPAFEPIVLARKPLAEKTVARNVLAHGTGAINIDGCRIGTTVETWPATRSYGGDPSEVSFTKTAGGVQRAQSTGSAPSGRWPANVLLDEHAAAWVDEQSGVTKSSVRPATGGPIFKSSQSFKGGGEQVDIGDRGHADQGGASRFFYSAKAPKSERPNVDGVQHPTVKPLAIMRWLIRLVTPPGGTVLDPFAGSGATIEAALIEGFSPIGIELEAEYLPLIQHRIDRQGGDES